MYAPNRTRSDGGIRMVGLGYRGPITEIDWVPDEAYPYAPGMEEFGGGGGGAGVVVDDANPPIFTEVYPAYGRPTVWPKGQEPTYHIETPIAPALAFNPPQGQVTVLTQPGQTPRVVVQTPGVYVDTSRIGRPATPSAEQTFEDLKNWLQDKTIFSTVPNWVVLLGGYFAFDALSKGGR
mgnify:CR=1 FL=1